MRRILFSIAAAAVASLVTLALAEAFLRVADYPPANFLPWIADRATGFRFASNLDDRMTGPDFDVSIQTNSHGFRDDPLGPKSGYRLLLLGDSFAAGYGVERGEMFADILERTLGLEVINAGTGGWELVHQVHFYKDRGKDLDADFVIYALYLGNDLTRNGEWEEGPDNALTSRDRSYPLRVERAAKLPMLFKNALYGARKRGAEARGEWVPFPDYLEICRRELTAKGREYYDTAFAHLAELIRTVGHERIFVVAFPFRTSVEPAAGRAAAERVEGLGEAYDLVRPGAEVRGFLQRAAPLVGGRVRAIDATKYLQRVHRAEGEPLYFPHDGHLNVRGHAALSAAIRAGLPRKLRAASLDAVPASRGP